MASFRQKKISRGQTLADKLHKTRLEQELSLEEISEVTKIQIKYLEILEEGNYKDLPGDIYAKAWIKLYGQALGLPIDELLADYKIEKTVSDKITKTEQIYKPKKRFWLGRIITPRLIKISGVVILGLALLGYLGWEINNIIAPPEVNIFEPDNNFKTTENNVIIRGQTKPEVQLTINNEMVLLDEEGKFDQRVNLVIGLNNLQISAKKKHSKINNLELIILREGIE